MTTATLSKTTSTTAHRHDQQRGPEVQTAHKAPTRQDTPTPGLALATLPVSEVFPCQDHPADLWFAELPEEVEAAKALCLECPIREACLAGALERREPWGVWGGQLVLQGVVVPRKRPRGRPRKDADAGQAA